MLKLVLGVESLPSLPSDNAMTINNDEDADQPADNSSAWKKWEDEIVLTYVKVHGTKWADVASLLPARTETSCRGRYRRMMKNLEKYGETKKPVKNRKANKANPKLMRDTIDSESSVDSMPFMVLPSEDELFAGIFNSHIENFRNVESPVTNF